MRQWQTEGTLAALRAAHRYQNGGPPLPYAVVRILEKKKLLIVYRKLNHWSEYSAPTRNNPLRIVQRQTIMTVILPYESLQLIFNQHE